MVNLDLIGNRIGIINRLNELVEPLELRGKVIAEIPPAETLPLFWKVEIVVVEQSDRGII
jgi:hypothetical protein